jgi:hypothetical protein
VLFGYSALGLACLGAAVAFFTSLLSFFSAELTGLLVVARCLGPVVAAVPESGASVLSSFWTAGFATTLALAVGSPSTLLIVGFMASRAGSSTLARN